MWQNAVRLSPRVIIPFTAPALPWDTTLSMATSVAGPDFRMAESTASCPSTGFFSTCSQTSLGTANESINPTSAPASATDISSRSFCFGEFPQSELLITFIATNLFSKNYITMWVLLLFPTAPRHLTGCDWENG